MNIFLTDPHAAEKLKARTALMEVFDPELSINIIDMGLVYDLDFSESGKIIVTMTLSTPHCPLGDAIESGVKNVLGDRFPDRTIDIDLVWEPFWSYDMISEAGKEQLGWG